MPEVDCELYKLITVGGKDAVPFLQGQLTQDVSRLTERSGMICAWCNPKGRVFAIIRLVQRGESIGLVVPASLAEQIVQRLIMYRLRSKVTITGPRDDWTDLIDARDADPVALIRAGVPSIDERNTETYTPHMLNLDKLGAISFNKGCYTGQEVVARTENLGTSKRRLMRYQASADSLAVGDKLSDGERNVGEVLNVVGRDLLAVTPVDLHDRELSVRRIAVTPMGLPY
ncbi:MAG: hypothetical protein O3A13_07180 [Proteobacteria bacterium]|nr:hypothetical protein [Pseudomonadota bacterium]MDA0993401.1 hypothetical protein [Pseudomonadota bacterium]